MAQITVPKRDVSADVFRGILAGLIGAVALGLYLVLVAVASGLEAWWPLKLAAGATLGAEVTLLPGFLVGPVLLGALYFLICGAIWGGVFGLIVGRIEVGEALLWGALFSLAAWGAEVYFFLSWAYPAFPQLVSPLTVGVGAIVYGLVLGATYPRLRPERPVTA